MAKKTGIQTPIRQTANTLALNGWPMDDLRHIDNKPVVLISIDADLHDDLLALCDSAKTWFAAGLQMSLTSQDLPAAALPFKLSQRELSALPESRCVAFPGPTIYQLAVSRGDLVKLAEHKTRFNFFRQLFRFDINKAILDASASPAYVA